MKVNDFRNIFDCYHVLYSTWLKAGIKYAIKKIAQQ